jgi:3-oxoacyl-[acyl-carrier-protein] synthase-3
MPEDVLSNADLEKIVDTSDEWIRQRTGIMSRRIVSKSEACSHLAVRAARAALADAKCDASELDLIILGTVTGDYIFPAAATLVQAALGATNAAAFDVSAACPGFIYAAAVGSQFIATGKCRRVLVIGAETLSRIVDYTDRSTCVIFGDGAGAAVLAPFDDSRKAEMLEFSLFSKGGEPHLLYMPAGGSKLPSSHETIDGKQHCIRMAGREVYRFAVESMVTMVRRVVEKYGKEEVALVVPHQMNRRIIESVIERLDLDPKRVFINIEKYGNTSAASVPVALAEAAQAGMPVPGKIVILCAVGAGFTWGSIVLRW